MALAVSPIARLLKLLNELLIETASYLPTTDLRFLSQANCALDEFVRDYLYRYRYNKGLVRLPKSVLHIIIQQLGDTNDLRNFAQTSQRFFPLAMDHMIFEDVKDKSSLLIKAAAQGLTVMMRRMISIGGDVNTQEVSNSCWYPHTVWRGEPPLSYAAHCGHEAIVRLLLDAGANQSVNRIEAPIRRLPLAYAIAAGHEEVALMLVQDFDELGSIDEIGSTSLRLACENWLFKLVRHLLSDPGRLTKERTVQDCSEALFHVLRKRCTYFTEDFVHRALHEEVYQLTVLLLEHGADPDMRMQNPEYYYPYRGTARELGAMHPDPRVRGLMAISIPGCRPLPDVPGIYSPLRRRNIQTGRTGNGTTSTAAAIADLWGYNSADMFSPWDYSDDELESDTSTEDGYKTEAEYTKEGYDGEGDNEAYSHDSDGKQLEVLETPSLSSQAQEVLDFWAKKPASVMLSSEMSASKTT